LEPEVRLPVNPDIEMAEPGLMSTLGSIVNVSVFIEAGFVVLSCTLAVSHLGPTLPDPGISA